MGVFLAAILFGFLYQGGAELALWTRIPRELIVVIQALVILFTGALDNMVRMPLERAFLAANRRNKEGRVMDLLHAPPSARQPLMRLAIPPLLLACLAGLFSERAGIFDIGLEGKMLAAAFLSAAIASTSRALLGLAFLAGIGASLVLSRASTALPRSLSVAIN